MLEMCGDAGDSFNTRIFFYKKPVTGHSAESFFEILALKEKFFCDLSTESFLFGFLNFYIAERITLKAVLASFIKHLLLTLFLAHRGLLMGRIKKKQTIIQLKNPIL